MRRPPMWLESAVDQLDLPLVLIGADRSVSYANHAAHRLFGLAPGHLEGIGVERLVVPERRGELRNVDDVLAGGGARRVRSVVRREDGSRVDVTMQLEACHDGAGQVRGVSIRYEMVSAAGRVTLGPGAPAATSVPPGEWPRSSGAPRSSIPANFAPSSAPPARHSERRLVAARATSELEQRLDKMKRKLQWLEERLSVPSSIAPLDDASERARAMLVVSELRGLVHDSLEDLERHLDVPAAPKLPKL